MNEMALKVKIPADAFLVALITRESLFSAEANRSTVRSLRDGFLSVTTYFTWSDWGLQHQKPALRSQFLGNIVFGMNVVAGEYPCITSGAADQFLCTRRKVAFCEEMQAKYKALDLEKERQKAMDYYAAKGIEILKN